MITVDNKVNDETILFEDLNVGDAFSYEANIYIKLRAIGEDNNSICLSDGTLRNIPLQKLIIEVDLLVSVIRKPRE